MMERIPPTISSTFLRSQRMTSGLFNTGVAGDPIGVASHLGTVQAKSFEDLSQAVGMLEPELDMKVFEDFKDFTDPLEDQSLDSFIDLTLFLSENPIIGQEEAAAASILAESVAENEASILNGSFAAVKEEPVSTEDRRTILSKNHDHFAKQSGLNHFLEETSLPKEDLIISFSPSSYSFLTTDTESKYRTRRETNNVSSKQSCKNGKQKFASLDEEAEHLVVKNGASTRKRSFAAVMEESASTEDGNTALSRDHDYVAKRPKLDNLTEETFVQNEELISPSPSPASYATMTASTENKYRTRREKNNMASKRSREIRKQKFVNMEEEAERLVIENAQLEKRIIQLEKLAKKMKDILVAKMAGK